MAGTLARPPSRGVLAAAFLVTTTLMFLVQVIVGAAEVEVDARSASGATSAGGVSQSKSNTTSFGIELPSLGLHPADAALLSPESPVPSELSFVPRSAVAAFKRDGHVVVPSIFTGEELGAFRPHLRAIVEERAEGTFARGSSKELNVAYEIRDDPHLAHLVSSKRLLGAARTLLGTSVACVWQDRTVFKDPGDRATHWHRDEQQNYGLDLLLDGE